MLENYDFPVNNRELSWLDFNERVMQEAENIDLPLIERMRFLGIYSNNQDEFFRVRVATLKRVLKYGKKYQVEYSRSIPPKELYQKINEKVKANQLRFAQTFNTILAELETQGVFMLNEQTLTLPIHQEFIGHFFRKSLRPLIFPIMLRNRSENWNLRDRSVYLVVNMSTTENKRRQEQAIIEVPGDQISRFVLLPDWDGKKYFMLIDDVIRYHLKEIFGLFEYNQFDAYTIKITRDAELDIDNDISKSFLELISESLNQRKSGIPVRVVIDKSMPENLLKSALLRIGVDGSEAIVKGMRYHNFKDFMGFPDFGLTEGVFPPSNLVRERRLENCKSILSEIRKKDVLLHFPFQSFQYIIDVLREASIDPKVKSIKMTIYRIAKISNVVNALINAARNGKTVTVFMELQARFDEQNNIFWSTRLQEEGVHVIQSIPGLKVHAKLIQIKRIDKSKEEVFSIIGTGNFNEITSRIYTDLLVMTSDKSIGKEVGHVFEMFQASYRPFEFKSLVVSPIGMRAFIREKIHRLIKLARAGKKAYAIIKLNNLVDEETVKLIYVASVEGVSFDFIVRGMCVLMPINKNIRIRSIVSRYLEHSRVLYFNNDGEEEVYLTSADWMTRNLDHRIEVAVPICDLSHRKTVLSLLELQLKDNTYARYVNGDSNNAYYRSGGKQINSQIETFDLLEKVKQK